jgi:hypothetical protein
MNCTLEEYIQDAKSHLTCNYPEQVEYITYGYTEQEINKNINYFEYQMKKGLSAYKALLFFHDYLEEGMDITPYIIVDQLQQKYY